MSEELHEQKIGKNVSSGCEDKAPITITLGQDEKIESTGCTEEIARRKLFSSMLSVAKKNPNVKCDESCVGNHTCTVMLHSYNEENLHCKAFSTTNCEFAVGFKCWYTGSYHVSCTCIPDVI